MPHDNEHNPDPNANASRIVRESTASADALQAEEAKLGERLTNYLPAVKKSK